MSSSPTVALPIVEAHQCRLRLRTIADTLYAIGGKWKLQIIVALLDGETRFNSLQRVMEGISSKVLAAELKELELNGLVQRKVQAGPPAVVEYSLTDYSQGLHDVLNALFKWGARHREEMRKPAAATALPEPSQAA